MKLSKTYYLQLCVLSLGALIISYGLSTLPSKYFQTSNYWISILFFGVTTLLANVLITTGEKASKEFVFKTLAMSMARLLLCMITVFIYSLINKSDTLAFTCHFMLQYILFTIFEISFLIKYIKQPHSN